MTNSSTRLKTSFRLSSNREIRDIIRSRAEEVKARESEIVIHNALVPLEFLNPDQVEEVKLEFLYTTGCELTDFVNSSAQDLCRNEIPPYVEELVEDRLSGLLRTELKADIFSLFSNKEKKRK